MKTFYVFSLESFPSMFTNETHLIIPSMHITAMHTGWP